MSTSSISGLDWQILELLQKDGRMTVSDIASQLNRSRSSITEHIENLRECGVLTGIHAVIDCEKLGFGIKAFVRLNADSLKHREIITAIISKPEVVECHVLTGSQLVIIQLAAKNMTHLRDTVDSFTQFGSTQTDIVFATVKDGIKIDQTLRTLLDAQP